MTARVLAEVERLRGSAHPDTYADSIAAAYDSAHHIAAVVVGGAEGSRERTWAQVLDRVLTHRVWGFLAMGLLFYGVFWVTIAGAAAPSDALFWLLVQHGHPAVVQTLTQIGTPVWLTGILGDGVYLGTAWVVAVMLPPMAIFFPLFALLEDFGYLPRVAFNLDRLFAGSGAHGKQSLTLMMGFGCNAAGVTAARIIDSPRERLIAIVTNNFSVCNGRWPTLILIGSIFLGSLAPASLAGTVAAASVVVVAILGILVALAVSWTLTRTVLRGETSFYALELPPYRRPQVWRTITTTMLDRTLKVLWRAVVLAAPAGALLWLATHVEVGSRTIAAHGIALLDPLGLAIGLNGVVLLAYVLAIPANEIVIPTILLLTLHTGAMAASGGAVLSDFSDQQAASILVGTGGWTLLTGVNLMLFSLLHNPCSTTVLTIWKETRSIRWTVVATLLPLALAVAVTAATTAVARIVGVSD